MRVLFAMLVTVLLFGPFATVVGSSECTVELDNDHTCQAILRRLSDDLPALRPLLSGARIAINAKFADPHRDVLESDEVALIGMVSGG